jgi:UDP-N-acetylmuramyl pentapeptide phosphotransferase/UDP-N-acetylglucosamine-1-phosphate transferase
VRWKSRVRIMDVPNWRSSHTRPKPRTGGIGLYAMFLLAFLYWKPAPPESGAVVLGATAFFLLGLLDDLYHLPEIIRLGSELLVSAALASSGLRVEEIALPFLGVWRLPWAVSVALTSFWCTGFLNAFNFMDGSDGLAAGTTVLVGLFMGALGGSPLPLIMSACAAGFLAFNWQPSRIFMGDSGSYLLGFLLSFLSVLGSREGTPMVVYVLFVLPFLADTSVTLIRRIARGEQWMKAHHSHHYQRLLERGWSHARVAQLYLALTAGLGATGLAYARASTQTQLAMLIFWTCSLAGALIWFEQSE